VTKSAIELLRERGLHAKKRFGQNFLLDLGVCQRIAEAASTPEGGTTLEIGPGLGALTRPLLARARKIVAIERDPELAAVLREELAEPMSTGQLTLTEGDALDVDWLETFIDAPRPHVVAGNLPYLITGRLLERSIEIAGRIDRAVFMVQAEVADRVVAAPGSDAYGALSVFVQAAFAPKKLLTVRGGAFHPRPEVDSTVVVLSPLSPLRAVEDDAFRALVKAGFGARRKTLRNAWKGLFGWSAEALATNAEAAGVALDRRAETLSVDEFERVAALARRSR
jgi:16S rRNA (adenine1518-N6/adenine1519-N6)-dimethyltransferase